MSRVRRFLLAFRRRGLRLSIAVVLAAGILPIGALGVWQAHRLLEETRQLGETALLGLASERAAKQRAAIDAGFAAIDGLVAGGTVPGPDCEATLRRFVEQSDMVVFAEYRSAAGATACRSDGARDEPLAWPARYADAAEPAQPARRVTVLNRGEGGLSPVVMVTLPVKGPAGPVGRVTLALERAPVTGLLNDARTARDYRVGLVGPEGEPLFGGHAPDWYPTDLARHVPADGGVVRVFSSADASGMQRTYGLATILPGGYHEVSTWEGVRPGLGAQTLAAAVTLPILTWLVAFGLAYVALERLIVLPIRNLRGDMRSFAFGRRARPTRDYADAAREIAELGQSFAALADKVIADEARQERLLDEKKVLLREIHHRVRNNLQIITSIIRMQARETEDPAGRAALSRLEDRALSISTIHGQIYETDTLDRVEARPLIAELATNVLGEAGGGSLGRIDPLSLDPERALCLAMIVTELLIASAEAGAGPEAIRLTLASEEEGRARLVVEAAAEGCDSTAQRFSGRLIRAFAVQLDAVTTRAETGGRARFELAFSTA